MRYTYHVPLEDTAKLCDKRGKDLSQLMLSMDRTAENYGVCHLYVTRSVADWSAGGYIFTSSSDSPSWVGLPITRLMTAHCDA